MATMEIVAPVSPNDGLAGMKNNRIQVSNTKKPLFFYVNLAKRYMQQHNEVELSALGMAIATVVTVSEILKNNGLAIEKKVSTSTFDMKDETKGRLVQKARIEIVLGKSENFETLINASNTQPKEANNTQPKEANNIQLTEANNAQPKETNNTQPKEANKTQSKDTNNTQPKEAVTEVKDKKPKA